MPASKGQWFTLVTYWTTLQGLSSGPVLGFSVNPRTVQNLKKGMAKTHSEQCSKQLQEVLNVSE